MANLVRQCNVGDGGRYVFPIVQQRHNARVQRFQGATVMLASGEFYDYAQNSNNKQTRISWGVNKYKWDNN